MNKYLLLIFIIIIIIIFATDNIIVGKAYNIKSQNDCPDGFLYHKESQSCYIIPEYLGTSEMCQREICAERNASLATVTKENSLWIRRKLIAHIYKNSIPHKLPDDLFVWMGLFYAPTTATSYEEWTKAMHWINDYEKIVDTKDFTNFQDDKSNDVGKPQDGSCGSHCGRMRLKTLKWDWKFCNDHQHNDDKRGVGQMLAGLHETQIGGASAYKCLCEYPRRNQSMKIFANKFEEALYSRTCPVDSPTHNRPFVGTVTEAEFFFYFGYILFLALNIVNGLIVGKENLSPLGGKVLFKTSHDIFPYISNMRMVPLFLKHHKGPQENSHTCRKCEQAEDSIDWECRPCFWRTTRDPPGE